MLKRANVVGMLLVVAGWAQHFPVTTAQLAVDVRPEAALTWQGDSVVLVKTRLTPGTQARVWADDTCGAPTADSQMIPGSGTVAIELASIGGAGKTLVCISSSDGRINANLVALHN
jgi:hypothetical protein